MALENIGYVEAAVLVGVVSIVFVMMVVQYWWRDSKNGGIVAWPVMGMLPKLLQLVPIIHDLATKILKANGGTFVFKGPWFTGLDFIITCDPSNLQHILSSNFANYPKGEEFREVFDVLGDGILNVDSDLWRLQRKMFQLWSRRHKSYASFLAKTMHRRMVNIFIPFLDNLSETGLEVNLQESFQRMITFDNAVLLTLGLDTTSFKLQLPEVEYQKAFEDIQQALFQRHILPQFFWKLQRWLKIGGEGKLVKGLKVFDDFMSQCISLKQEQLTMKSNNSKNNGTNEEDEETGFGLLSIYLEEKEKPYSAKFLKDMSLNFVGAARDTLNASLTWFFWLVATHPRVEAKIIEEMKQYLDLHDQSNSFGPEELSKLIYLQAALYELFRLYPPIPFNHRTAAKDDILPSGHHVNKKQRVLLSLYSSGRMKTIWGKDCFEFKPERWITEERGLVYVPFHKYPVFNGGPRTCLGKDMAVIQMKVAAVSILSKFSFQVVEGHPISPSLTITLNMKNGLMVKVLKRC